MVNGEYILVPRRIFDQMIEGTVPAEGILDECRSVILSNIITNSISVPSSPMEHLPVKLKATLEAAEVSTYSAYQQKVHGFFCNLQPDLILAWSKICPVNLDLELVKMYVWLMSNRNKPKKNIRSFCSNWVSRSTQSNIPMLSRSSGTAGREL